MRVVVPFDKLTRKFNSLSGCRNAIFLAGPCPREDFNDDWRFDAFSILEELGFDGVVLSPTNPHYMDMVNELGMPPSEAREKQVSWERAAMHVASAIVFWVPRSEKFPALTTNYEFGEWYKKPHMFVGWPEDAEHCDYMRCKLKEQNKTYYSTLEGVLRAAVMALKKSSGPWFTSDTHFCQQRTLELSRRPFVDVQSMDYEMVSNWNKRVTMQDEVIHAGDFIDPEKASTRLGQLLSMLNFKRLHWVLGNYDRKIKDLIAQTAAESGREIVIYDFNYAFATDKHSYVVVHEPNDFEIDASPNDIILYGHIHGRSFAKKNGFDLGIDYHQYSPISIEQVECFANAMKYWDKNVYSDACSLK
jgi:calcineurin-like phosphoesterase family protein